MLPRDKIRGQYVFLIEYKGNKPIESRLQQKYAVHVLCDTVSVYWLDGQILTQCFLPVRLVDLVAE